MLANNYMFPFPLWFHILFSVVGLLFFLFQYKRRKYAYYLLLAIAIPSTLLIYFCKTDLLFALLGIEELVLFVLILVFIAKAKKIETVNVMQEHSAKNNQDEISEVNNGDENGNS